MRVSSGTLTPWYHQLAASLEAGLSLERAIGAAAGPPEKLRAQLQARLVAGDTVAESLERGGAWLPAVDRQLLAAGAAAGRLPEVCRRLSARHDEAVRAGRIALLASAYPLAVAHLAVVALPIAKLVNGEGAGAYAWSVLRILVPFWLVIALFVWAARREWRVVAVVLDALPFVGAYRKLRAVADLAFVLEAQLTAGIALDIAWLQAALAAGERRFEKLALEVAETVQRGEVVSPVLRRHARETPPPFADFYANGEQTGRLDENLAHLQRQFRERASTRVKIASMVYPALLFLFVAAWVGFQVIRFWMAHFKQLEDLAS